VYALRGYRVVACTASAVIHRGFSERVFLPGFFYYALRNHLYFAAKTYHGLKRWYYLAWLFGVLHYLSAMFGVYPYTRVYYDNARQALDDFIQDRQGKSIHPANQPKWANLGPFACPRDKQFLVNASLPAVDMQKLMTTHALCDNQVTLLVPESRKNLFAWYSRVKLRQGRDRLDSIAEEVDFVKFITDHADPLHYRLSDNIVTLDMQGNVVAIEHLTPAQRRRKIWYLHWLKWTQFLRGALRGFWYCLSGH
jgi:hypothetical protein